MLRGMLIAPDPRIREAFAQQAAESGQVLLVKTFDRYLGLEELRGQVRAHAPQVLFLDAATRPESVGAAIGAAADAIPVALHHTCDPQALMTLLHTGVREFLYLPFAGDQLAAALDRLTDALRDRPAASPDTELVYAFLPAKPGCGASTAALNAAFHLAPRLEGRVLLADGDLNCGILRFLLKLTNPFSIADALEKAGDLEPSLWAELVSAAGKVDVLASGAITPAFPADPAAIRKLVEFARRHYGAVLFDLSGNMERYSVDLLAAARRILLVIRPCLATVHLAREKLRYLRSLDLEDRVSLLLNRWSRDAVLSIADIESVLGHPVEHTVPEDAKGVYQAMLAATAVDASSDSGQDLAALAATLADTSERSPTLTPRKRMIEYFSVLPGRYTLLPTGRT